MLALQEWEFNLQHETQTRQNVWILHTTGNFLCIKSLYSVPTRTIFKQTMISTRSYIYFEWMKVRRNQNLCSSCYLFSIFVNRLYYVLFLTIVLFLYLHFMLLIWIYSINFLTFVPCLRTNGYIAIFACLLLDRSRFYLDLNLDHPKPI